MNMITNTITIGNNVDAVYSFTRQAEGIRSLLCLDGMLKPADSQRLGPRAAGVHEVAPGIEHFAQRVAVSVLHI